MSGAAPRDLRALVESVTGRPGYTAAVGTEVLDVTADRVVLQLARRADLLQGGGHFHGGVIAALADHAAGAAVTVNLAPGWFVATVDLHVSYLRPASLSHLRAHAYPLRVGRTVASARVDVTTADGRSEELCAVALVSLRVVSGDREQPRP